MRRSTFAAPLVVVMLAACGSVPKGPASPHDFAPAKHGYYRLSHPNAASLKVGQLADVSARKFIRMTVQGNVPSAAFPVIQAPAADIQLAAHTVAKGGLLVLLKDAGFEFAGSSNHASSMTMTGLMGEAAENIAPLVEQLRGVAKNSISPVFREQIQAPGVEVVIEVVYASSYSLAESDSEMASVKILDPIVGSASFSSASTETQTGNQRPLPILFRTTRLALPSLNCFEVPPAISFRGSSGFQVFQVGNQCKRRIRWWRDLTSPSDVKLLPGGETLAAETVGGDIHVLRREGCQDDSVLALRTDADSAAFYVPVTFEKRCLSLKQLSDAPEVQVADIPAVKLEREATKAFYTASYARAYATARAAQKASPSLKTEPGHQRLVEASRGLQHIAKDLPEADVDILKGFSEAAFDIEQKDWEAASDKLAPYQWGRIADSSELQKAATLILRMLRPSTNEFEVRNVAVEASSPNKR